MFQYARLESELKEAFGEGFSSSTTKEIIIAKDDSYYFVGGLKFRECGSFSEGGGGRGG